MLPLQSPYIHSIQSYNNTVSPEMVNQSCSNCAICDNIHAGTPTNLIYPYNSKNINNNYNQENNYQKQMLSYPTHDTNNIPNPIQTYQSPQKKQHAPFTSESIRSPYYQNCTLSHSTNINNQHVSILEYEISMETLLNALQKGIVDSQNALRIAKMVSSLINKQTTDASNKKIIKTLVNENIVNILLNSITKHPTHHQLLKECQWAIKLMIKGLLVHNKPVTTYTSASIQIGAKQSNNIDAKATYKCEDCGKMYKHMCNLKTHQKIHTDNCYVCSFCKKRFGRKYNYIEHVRVHTGEAPFQCSVCNKRFKQKNGWKNHIKKIHLHLC